MENTINILHLEDDPNDARLIQWMLKKANISFEYFLAEDENEYLSFLQNQKIDIILSDFHLPNYTGTEALLLAKTDYPHIPFVFVSGTMGEEVAIESLLNGATDYVLKNRLERLETAVKRAVRESRLQQEYLKTAETLQQKEEQYRTLVEGMNEGLMLTDIKDKILFVNQKTSDITGYSANELIGKKCHEVLFEYKNNLNDHLDVDYRKIGGKNIYETEIIKKDRSKTWIQVSCSPVFDEQKNISGLIEVFEDINERKKAEDEREKLNLELINAKEKAEESDRLKSAFLANISHEIRTPMNGILGFAELLKTPELDQDIQNRYIHIIEKSGKRMLNIINDIVDISKIEAGQMNIQIQETNVNQLIKDLKIFFQNEANKQGLSLNINYALPDEQSNFQTDHTKLAQILSNLIKNALKFTKTGAISFGYNLTNANSVLNGVATKTNELTFYVKDTGVGIPPDQTEFIFERFRQGSVSFNRAYEGAGLGLSISKAFVEMLGGRIWVESEVGKGSVFYFQLPFATPDQKLPEAEKDHHSKTQLQTLHILITEDDKNSMMLAKIILEDENIVIFEARNGLEAIGSVKNHPEIDLVLMDLKLPAMDGFEATRQIKKLRPNLPVIAQTAYAFVEDKDKALAAGCDDYLSKPIIKLVLLEKIQKLIRKKNSNSSAR
jgi:PAS domain S-box-containing protein